MIGFGSGPPPVSGRAVVREPRNQIIDVARVAAVVMVVVFHSTLFRMDLTPQGPVAHPWEPGPWWWPWSWLAMSVPLFFVASGYVAAIAVDRLEPGLEGYARYVIHRSLRLVGPLVLFVTVVVGAATWAAWQVGEPPPTLYPGPDRDSWLDAAASVSKDSLFFLWFVAIWLALLSIAPLMVWAHDRGGAVPVVVLGLAAAALDMMPPAPFQPPLLRPAMMSARRSAAEMPPAATVT